MSNTNYTTYNNFETGAIGHFDSTDDTDSRLSYAHYTDLARVPGLAMPYRGAYCLRVNLAGMANANASLTETGSWDVTTTTEDIYIRFKLWISTDIVMANNDEFGVCVLSSAAANEAGVWIKYTTAGGYVIGVGKTTGTASTGFSLGQWHDVEMYFNPASGTGTIDWWLDGTAMAQVGSLTDLSTTYGSVGVFAQDAGTTAGTVLIDQVISSQTDNTSTRIGSGGKRFPKTVLLEAAPAGTTGHHAFVGHGVVDNVSLLSGNAVDNVLQLWDTDRADTTNGTMKLELRNLTALETPIDPAGVPIDFTKGCYVRLSGTTPRAMMNIHRAVGYYSDGAIRNSVY